MEHSLPLAPRALIWEEDRTAVKAFVDRIRERGVCDIGKFFDHHPEELIRCRNLISISHADPEVLQFFNISRIDDIPPCFASFFPIESLPGFRDELVALADGRETVEYGVLVRKTSGPVEEMVKNVSLLPGSLNSWKRVRVTCKNNTDTFNVDDENRAADRLLENLIRYVNAPIIVWNRAAIITHVSAAVLRITGIPSYEIVGNTIDHLIPVPERERAHEFIRMAEGREHGEAIAIPILQKTGDVRMILWSFAHITHSSGEIIATIAQGQDITEQKWAMEYMKRYISELIEKNHELEGVRHQLEELNQTLDGKVQKRTQDIESLLKQKDEFITQIGHDLKTPLTPILALLPVLLKKEQDPKRVEYLQMAIRNANHLHNLLFSIIRMARLSKAYLPNSGTILQIYQMIEELIINFEFDIMKKRMTVENNIPEDMQIRMSPIDFDTMFGNILDNAIKYSNTGSIVRFDGIQSDTEIIIQVKDTGIGLQPAERIRVFEKFYKADSSRHDAKSYGLGLSITRDIVERNGGIIQVESEGTGKGTTFILTFPFRSEYLQ
ncbi:MAG TPA: PAS domain-containing sensor histidine kinase [Methanospirillum sp.]|nr:PAS domain-containing sensor histidine kinase [Methanospirillum sp.]